MDWPALIDRLAALAGIEPYYFDIHGVRHDAALGTKVLVLSALDFDVSSAVAVQQAIAECDSAPWKRRLPKTVFHPAGRSDVDIELCLPAAEAGRVWRWEVELESKELRHGEFRPEDLALTEAKEIDGRRIERRRLRFNEPLPEGYHRLRLISEDEIESQLIATPEQCYLPPPLERGERLWGVSAHIYSLRSRNNWGIGDFGDLKRLARLAGQAGASFVAVNPFHALFATRPERASPYSPSSRLFLNPVYIDVEDAPNASDSKWINKAANLAAGLRETPLVDYPGVWSAKCRAFEEMWAAFERVEQERPASGAQSAFAQFTHTEGDALKRFAVFCTLDEELSGHMKARRSWRSWPERYRNPDSAAVRRVADEKASRVRFHQYLQFLADRQLAGAAAEARRNGAGVGLVRDLALGIDPDGADAWSHQRAFAGELRCGAPRDEFHPTGQEWGVLPFNPVALRDDYTPFIELLRANMRHAGGLRIDHVIGVERQFLVPVGDAPTLGCYVRYPREQLLGLMALESRRNNCMVIGEDLGTVPEGLRERMRQARMFGCSILYFERDSDGRFRSPAEYRKQTVASAGTHDLPTIRGYWSDADIAARERAGLQSTDVSIEASARRSQDKKMLLDALARAGAWNAAQREGAISGENVRNAIHAFLALSAAQLFAAQLDDLFDEEMQLNVPGTVDAYPNWRRKLGVGLDQPEFSRALAELALAAKQRFEPSR